MADPSELSSVSGRRAALPGRFDLVESARRLGACAWVEERLFEVLGSWVQGVPEPAVKIALARHSRGHAAHALLLSEAVPRRHDGEDVVVAGADGLAAVVEALVGTEGTVERLTGVVRVVVPRMVAAYAYHLEGTSRVADTATARALRMVLADEIDHWREGETLLQGLLRTPRDVEAAARAQGALESLVVAAGGIAGPGTLG
ncbi:MAG: hypothetical protein M5U14_18615 [Acidimicrobiia bacterium]|nr:hypothetical protein [Acidimicrobiia bacterium]